MGIGAFMGRPLRIEYPGALYHITSRGNEKRDIFLEDSDRNQFLELLEDYHERFDLVVHCFVLMGNHYHLTMETPRGNLLKVMHGINSSYTGYFNRKYDRVGHLFQGRYRGILVDKDSYLLELTRYVHLNPVRAKMVKRPEEYPWSSYVGYVWKRRQLRWMEYAWVLSQFGPDEVSSARRYRRFVESGMEEPVGSPFSQVAGQVLLGGEELLGKVKRLLRGKEVGPGVVERTRFLDTPGAEYIISMVASILGVDRATITQRGGRGNEARNVAMYLVQRHSGLSNREIGSLFGGIQPSAVAKTSARVEAQMQRDKKTQDIINTLISRIKA
jgi:REP element-mobilizing transposase RayT